LHAHLMTVTLLGLTICVGQTRHSIGGVRVCGGAIRALDVAGNSDFQPAPNTQHTPCPCIFKFGNCCRAEHSFERDRSPQVRRELVSRVASVHQAHVINSGFVTSILGAATSPISCVHLSTCVKGRGITASKFAASRISHWPK